MNKNIAVDIEINIKEDVPAILLMIKYFLRKRPDNNDSSPANDKNPYKIRYAKSDAKSMQKASKTEARIHEKSMKIRCRKQAEKQCGFDNDLKAKIESKRVENGAKIDPKSEKNGSRYIVKCK